MKAFDADVLTLYSPAPLFIDGGTPAGFLNMYRSPNCKRVMKTISCVCPARCIRVRRIMPSTVPSIMPLVTSYWR